MVVYGSVNKECMSGARLRSHFHSDVGESLSVSLSSQCKQAMCKFMDVLGFGIFSSESQSNAN
jgi:hypothetical protein